MRSFAEEQWVGPPKIILGIDIGTTQSAIAFAYLYPDGPQSLHRVCAWPGLESQRGVSKIPSLVYCDTDGKAVWFGTDALKPEIADKAGDNGWQLARHFKLHLHPDAMKQKHNLKVQALPRNVDLLTVYTDFMVYLMKHTQQFFESRIPAGRKVWAETFESMSIAIAHPNGWTAKEQNFLRKAAVAAKYTTHANARSQIRFVSEAEASVHVCMFRSDLYNRLKPNVNLIVCDAGGLTVETTAYCVKTASPMLELEEKKAPVCVQAGAVFIDLECEKYLCRVLNTLGLPEQDCNNFLKRGVRDFEGVAKREFYETDSEHRVDLGAGRLSRPELNIKRGVIKLDGTTIRSFFDSSVGETVASVRQQVEGLNPKHILLVGGFGDNLYLRKILEMEFSKDDCSITIANDLNSKSVAVGAVIWCAKHPSENNIISSNLSMDEMFQCLLDHGCKDISSRIAPDRHSSTAVAGGSFGDIWTSETHNGAKIAIKCLRFHVIAGNRPKSLKRATREIYMWSKAKHPNDISRPSGHGIYVDGKWKPA